MFSRLDSCPALAGLVLALLLPCQQLTEPQGNDRRYTIERGWWSRDTILLTYYVNSRWPADEKRKEVDIKSPDASMTVKVETSDDHGTELTHLALYKTHGRRIGRVLLQNHPEMAWAPNSKAFFINETDGSSVNGWSLRLFIIRDHSVKEVNVAKNFQRETTRYFQKAPWTEMSRKTGQNDCEADTAGIKWLDAAKLLVVARIPNTSYCRNMMEFRAYVISIPSGQILERISEQQFKTSYWKQTETIFP